MTARPVEVLVPVAYTFPGAGSMLTLLGAAKWLRNRRLARMKKT